jgi:hypothetical protein
MVLKTRRVLRLNASEEAFQKSILLLALEEIKKAWGVGCEVGSPVRRSQKQKGQLREELPLLSFQISKRR